MYKTVVLCILCIAVAVESGKSKGGKCRRCCKEKDVLPMVSRWIADFVKAFNENRIGDIDDLLDETIFMPKNAPTVVGKPEKVQSRQDQRDREFDRIEAEVLVAKKISCNRIYMIENVEGYKNGTLVNAHWRIMVIWKKVGGKWFREVIMTNDGA